VRKITKLSIIFSIILISTSFIPYANAKVIAGTKCSKLGSTQIYNGKKYSCIKLGNNLYWNNGIKISNNISPSPKPSQTNQVLNTLAGLFWSQKSSGVMNLSMLMKNIASNYSFIADGLDFANPFPGNYKIQDIWQDKIISCPSFCLTELYLSELKSTSVRQISLDKIQHPDIFSYSILKGANFGSDSRFVFALTSFQPIDGVNSVIYKIDTQSGNRMPIYATYCYSTSSKSCSYGYRITGLKTDHHSKQLAIVVEALGNIEQGYTSSFIMTIDQDSGPITLKSFKNIQSDKKIYYDYSADSKAQFKIVNNVNSSRPIQRLSGIQFLQGSTLMYFRSNGDVGKEINEICRVGQNGIENCSSILPFKFISDLQSLSEDVAIFSSFDFNNNSIGGYIYNFSTSQLTPITNFTTNTVINSFTVPS